MIKGYWERRISKQCESIYLYDSARNIAFTFSTMVHKLEDGEELPSTDLSDNEGLISALAQALQAGGYIPKSAVDAELAATKYHLEDMRTIVHGCDFICGNSKQGRGE